MAVDPNTGQTVINIPGFDQKYAGFIDPTQFGQLAAQQGQMGQQNQLAQAMMQAGYTPNSGRMGVFTQALQALVGARMMAGNQDKQAALYQQQLEAVNKAAQAAHAQQQQDLDAASQRDITKAVGIHKGEGDYDLSVQPQKNAYDIQKAGAVAKATADAQLPDDLRKIAAQGANAMAVAEAGHPRAYVMHSDTGADVLMDTKGNVVGTVPSAGGGKLSPTDAEVVKAKTASLQQFQQKALAADETRVNLHNYVSNLTGLPLEDVTKMNNEQIRDAVKNTGFLRANTQALGAVSGMGSPVENAANSAALSYAGTIRATPTDTDVKAAKGVTPSVYQNTGVQAQNIYSMLKQLDEVKRATAQTQGEIDALNPRLRNTGAQSMIPQGSVTPTSPTGAPHFIFDSQTGQLVPQQ